MRKNISPHLQIYAAQFTSMLSILHRVSGIFLVLSLCSFWTLGQTIILNLSFYNFYFLISLFFNMQAFFLFFIIGFFIYHLTNGIRHLIWDSGHLLTNEAHYKSSYLVILLTIVTTNMIWCVFQLN